MAVPSSAVAPARLTASTSCGAQVSASGAAEACAVVGEHARRVPRGVGGRGAEARADHDGDDVTSDLLGQLRARGQRRQRRRADPLFVRLAEDDDGGHQITFASLWSLATSSSTEATLTPALRTGGASYDVTFIAAFASTPSSASVTSLISFFFAAMIPFSEA